MEQLAVGLLMAIGGGTALVIGVVAHEPNLAWFSGAVTLGGVWLVHHSLR